MYLVQLPEQASELALLSPLMAEVQGDISKQAFALEAELAGIGYEQLRLRAEGGHEGHTVVLGSVSVRDEASQSSLRASGSVDITVKIFRSARFSNQMVSRCHS